MSVTFRLRPEAKFRDGTPVTAADVVFTLRNPEAEGPSALSSCAERHNEGRGTRPGDRALQFTGEESAICRAGGGAAGTVEGLLRRERVLTESSIRRWAPAPTSSAISSRARSSATSAARTIGRKTCPSTAGASTSTNCASSTIATGLPARGFKAGAYDLREEFTSKAGPRATTSRPSGRARSSLTLPDESPSGAQGFFLNTRRSKLADLRVRKALDYAFDFEWTNKIIFYGLYTRTESFFENSDMKARASRARPSWRCWSRSAASCRPRCSASLYTPPVSDGSGQDRPSCGCRAALGRGRLALPGRRAQQRQGRDARDRVPDRRSRDGAHHRPLFVKPAGSAFKAVLRRIDPAQNKRR